ncbi:hypothetical protein [Novosphingobium panipatense]|uniref:Polysaccharide lyase-like protein n=1 Tax=Novosphingobium panipatense TaxID=428991 RepID=A0ABY1QPG6_9SPHN|nr:hypothetical protein [Novosphingobium panipatense]SMP75455.1 hypothetical protein SAMN06296065_10864 [Novosphingobium panipatense]
MNEVPLAALNTRRPVRGKARALGRPGIGPPLPLKPKVLLALTLPLIVNVAAPARLPAATPSQPPASFRPLPAEESDRLYPFYMPMEGLRAPATTLRVKCEASRAAGREVYEGRGADPLQGRAEGGYEFIYEATDSRGRPCVYPFSPWMPQVVGALQGTQYIFRSSVPGSRITFRTADEWATLNLRLFEVGEQRVHFEMRDIELDFPGAIQPKGAVHLEVTGTRRPGLFTAVLRRVRVYGGKNAIFIPNGQTMLYIEDGDIAGNVGTNTDQEHTAYINGTLVSHFRNTEFHGQRAWQDLSSGHQLKDKAYLRVYENVTVSNTPQGSTPSAMPLVDASAFGFTWADGLRIRRIEPAQAVREGLVDLRTDILYGERGNYPWSVVADPVWTMPSNPLAALDKVYLSVFLHTSVESFRDEPFVFALRTSGRSFGADGTHVEGDGNQGEQRAVSLAYGTTGRFERTYAPGSWTYTDPQLPPGSEWVLDRNRFIRHALGLIGR